MGHHDHLAAAIAAYSPLDIMLADIAVRIQLSPTDYLLAVQHYLAVSDWLDGNDSPLQGRVQLFYPQGGFTIGATVARHSSDDEFDIDGMAQLALRSDVDPETALALLHQAIRREHGTRYYDKVERKTRCSTINYDRMHLDVTPAVRIAGNDHASLIFHSKPEDPKEPKLTLHANPFGFARWFNRVTPPDAAFGRFFEKRSLDFARGRAQRLLEEKAETVPVPDQLPAYHKSLAVIALQLEKRWRNLAYDKRHPNLRRPPSILESYYNALHANQTRSLADELIHQIDCKIAIFAAAVRENRRVREFNPACEYRRDELTDRWPATMQDQRVFLDELVNFSTKLHRLRRGAPLEIMQEILSDLFGEKPTGAAIEQQVRQRVTDRAAGVSLYVPRSTVIPPLGALAAPSIARAAPSNTFFGD
jgi:hypothetical protein